MYFIPIFCYFSLTFICRYASGDKLLGSVDYYHKHLFVPVPGNAASWPSHLEKSHDSEFSLFNKIVHTAKATEAANQNLKIQVTGIETNER